VIRDKRGVAADVRNKNKQSASYRYHPNRPYDEMVTRLFKNLLHKDAGYQVCFSRRGSKDRTEALKVALEQARENFRRKWNIVGSTPIEVTAKPSQDNHCLQAVDYFPWALQRIYAKGEDRYLQFLWSKVGVIQDVDDRRKSRAGVYYGKDNPLTTERIQNSQGYRINGEPAITRHGAEFHPLAGSLYVSDDEMDRLRAKYFGRWCH
jgi:hypothetical protein